ncbi:MAG: hypothetical protein JXR83_05485 [Deltaproteobacteria bacterium]|nr:hypothetical protein [Deltaproteobacteria bacterium]
MRGSGLVFLMLMAPVLGGCDGLGHAGQRPSGTRQVTLTVPVELVSSLGGHVTAVQLAAAVVDGSAGFTLHTSPAVDPAIQTSLIGYFPAAESLVLVVQSGGSGGAGTLGALLAQVRFADGRGGQSTLVPRGGDDLALGRPLYEGTSAADGWLTVDDGHNPLAAIDSDGDGTSDLGDDDDDGDGVPDCDDQDLDGDGRIDLQQSLLDGDGDGIPDIYE